MSWNLHVPEEEEEEKENDKDHVFSQVGSSLGRQLSKVTCQIKKSLVKQHGELIMTRHYFYIRLSYNMNTKGHNIFQIHNNVMWDLHYSTKCPLQLI